VLTFAVRPLSIFCAALVIMYSGALSFEQRAGLVTLLTKLSWFLFQYTVVTFLCLD
jgi:hypothetical protein